MRVLIHAGLAAFFPLVLPISAQGVVRRFMMDGIITEMYASPGLPTFAMAGDRVAYMFAFDSESEDTNPSPGAGSYVGINSQATIKEQTFAGLAPLISIRYGPAFPGGSSWFSVQSGLIPDQSSVFTSAVAFFNLNDTNDSDTDRPEPAS